MFAASKTAAAAAGTPPPSSADPQFNYVSLLLNDTGTNGAQNNTFLDSSSNNFTITRNGTPTQGSVTPYWPDGQWSNYFNGSTDWIRVPYSASLLPASGTDFTAECWVYLTGATAAFQFVMGMNNRFVADWQIVNENGQWSVYLSGAGGNIGAVVANQWTHIAVVRSGSNLYAYLNGTRIINTAAGTQSNNNLPLHIGARSGTDRYFPGYISNARTCNSAVYTTSSFTVPTTPLTAVSGTSLLTCQSNRFKDNSSNNFAITVTGTPTVQSFDPFSPASSYATSVGGSYLGATGNYLSFTGTNTAFQFGTGDWTVECWVYANTLNADQYVWDFRPSSNGAYPALDMSNVFKYVANAAVVITGTTTVRAGTWYHVAVCRSGTSTRLFVNGVQEGSTYTDSTNYIVASNRPYIGVDSFSGSSFPFIGYISNLRIVKGTAVYTANFTPPASPVTAITGTSLLLNFTNAGIYDAATLNNLTTVGDAKVSTAQAKFGSSSMAFDGTGDWLTFVDSPNGQLGTGNFTIEGWVYLSTTGTAKYVAAKGTSTTGWALGVNSSNQIVFNYTSSTLTGSTALSSGQWYHIAVVRNGTATGNVKIYLGGTADATSGGAINDNFNQTSIGYVGADRTGTNAMNGYLDDLRITKDYARYTANFTPPTAPFPTR